MLLVLNCGSQSIKWKLFDDNLKVKKGDSFRVENAKDYHKVLIGELAKLKGHKAEIKIIGHRFVHGGDKFYKPVIISAKNLTELKGFNNLAPLHNPYNVLGIEAARKVFPSAKQIAVFDTEFYSGLAPKVYIYPLPEKIREKYHFRKFGFHGISHEYVAKEGAKIIGKPFKGLKIISCHFGGGASITATNKGKAVDTSMGFSPLEGVAMMTRPGSIDPQIILELLRDLTLEKVEHILNFESGLKGICGEGDMLSLLKKIKKGDKKAKLALDIYVYQIKKYIGSYFAVLKGCDLLVFTGAIGSGSSKIRRMICQDMPILRNTKVIPIKPGEELAIAKKIKNL